ncbi:MAG: hypothetical protein EZS28_035252, partial [Streblomastix strix]
HGLIELDLFNKSAQTLDLLFISNQIQSSYSQSSIRSQVSSEFPLKVLLNILQVVQSVNHASPESFKKANKLKSTVEGVKIMNPQNDFKGPSKFSTTYQTFHNVKPFERAPYLHPINEYESDVQIDVGLIEPT